MKLLPRSLLDELAAGFDEGAHQAGEEVVGVVGVVDFHLQEGDSYFRPHRHLARAELAMLLRGKVEIVTFDERGRVTARHEVGEGTANMAYETPPATWHTVIAAVNGTAFLEIKQGPYDPSTTSEFAAWAPAEGAAAVADFQHWLRTALPGEAAPRAGPG